MSLAMSTLNKSLSLQQVSLKIGEQTILKDIDLELAPETIYTVLGPSGTGKSSLLKIIAGLLPKSGGEMSFNGKPYQAKDHVIGLVPQNYGLLPWQSAWQAVSAAYKISTKQTRLSLAETTRLEELFTAMNISELKTKYPYELSGGQQQRVSITRAFAVAGDFLLMDEPFSALDAFTREKAQGLFRQTWQAAPRTTLFITHDIAEAVLLGEKIILMTSQPGKILRVLDNPLFNPAASLTEIQEQDAFYQLLRSLREELQPDEN